MMSDIFLGLQDFYVFLGQRLKLIGHLPVAAKKKGVN